MNDLFKYASVCSGAEAFGPAWHKMGMVPVFHAEIEKNAAAVLRLHNPEVPNHGDFTKINTNDYPPGSIQLLAGGTPCQSFSIAGLRGGLADARGNLTMGFLGLAAELQPKWILWENVPGVLSADGGRAFGSFLGGLAQLGYGFAYRVLDAQYFGVPQRRKRVFVVGYLGDWRRAAAVLFESHSLQGHPAPSREKGQGVTPTVRAGAAIGGKGRGARSGDSKDELIIPVVPQIAKCLTVHSAGAMNLDFETADFVPVAFGWQNSERQGGSVSDKVTPTLDKSKVPAVAYTIHGTDSTATVASESDTSTCLRARAPGTTENSSTTVAMQGSAVRRLTPVECERLQGWPDDWTKYGIDEKGRRYELSDSARYRIIGNGWAAPVANWIAKRIKEIDLK